MKLMLTLLLLVGAVAFTSCKKLPSVVTISGKVTDEARQPFEGVQISVFDEPWFSGYGIVGSDWYTDVNGDYQVDFEPSRSSGQYSIRFEITKDDNLYSYSCDVDKYQAVQIINVVLTKND